MAKRWMICIAESTAVFCTDRFFAVVAEKVRKLAEQSASIDEIASSSQALAHLAMNLREAVSKFKV